MSILSLNNVEFTLKGPQHSIKILRHINFTAQLKDSIAITGPSGSGKTSLMMLMAGIDLPTSGSINVAGKNILKMNEDQRAKFRAQHIGILFQSFHLIPTMTAIENTALPLEFLKHPKAWEEAKIMLEKVGLKKRGQHYPAQMSGGEQQRVAIARALIAKPTILLADEPTGNLDTENSNKIIKLIFDMHYKQENCLILVTHDLHLAQKCKRQLYMRDGIIK